MLEPLKLFLKKSAQDVDVFCFQEVFNGISRDSVMTDRVANIYSEVSSSLPDYNGFHAVAVDVPHEEKFIPYGIAIFVKKNIEILSQGSDEIFSLYEEVDAEPEMIQHGIYNRLLQHVTIPFHDSTLTIFNLHGFHSGRGKDDSKERFVQSERVRKSMSAHEGSKILCGDFNLDINTESLAMLEDGMRNLLKESGAKSTRSHFYEKEGKFADYILASSDIPVVDFRVLDDVVSDHLPLVVEIS